MNPVGLLFFLFLLVPLVEIYFLIEVGSIIGPVPTIALVVFTALLGAMLLRFQGLATLQRTRMTMAQGQLPALEMMEGVLLLFSGALLLTPGFFTDAVGFAFLVPAIRKALIHWFLNKSNFHAQKFGETPKSHRSGPYTIDGEYRRDDD